MRQSIKVMGILGIIVALWGCYEPPQILIPVKELSVKPESRTLKIGESIEFYVSAVSLDPQVKIEFSKYGPRDYDLSSSNVQILKGTLITPEIPIGNLNFIDAANSDGILECHIKFTPESKGQYRLRFVLRYDQYINGDLFEFNVTE
jgi:hypothetical protein